MLRRHRGLEARVIEQKLRKPQARPTPSGTATAVEDKAAALSRLTIAGRVHNSCLAAMYSNSTFGAIDVHLALAELDRSVEMVHHGDLGGPEALEGKAHLSRNAD